MDISPQWTDDERFVALAFLAQRIKSLATLEHPGCPEIIWQCADAGLELATASVERLEVLRHDLLKQIHGK